MAYRAALIVAVSAALLPLSAGAARVQVSHFPPNPNVLPGGGWKFSPNTTFGDPPPARQWVEGVYGAQPTPTSPALIVKDVVKLAGRAGDLPVTVAQAITVVDAAISVAACINGAVLGCISAGAAAVTLYNQWRVRPAAGGGLEADPGQDQQSIQSFKCGVGGSSYVATGASPAAACQASLERYSAANPPTSDGRCRTVHSLTMEATANPNSFTLFDQLVYEPVVTGAVCPASGAKNPVGNLAASATSSLQCPALVDFSDPRYSLPGGPTGADGKCPTGRYQGISVVDAAAKVSSAPNIVSNPAFKQAVQDVIDNQGQTAPGDLTSSGPASQSGTPTSSTTTDSTGTKTTTTTPTYTYHYDGDTITYDTSSTVQTCVGSNSCSTTTTTTPASPADAQDPTDPCTKNPNRAGCADLGTPPGAEEMQKKDIPISVTPESGFGADNGQCPGPITLASGVVVDPYGLFCKYMAGIRFAVIGIAWIIAALIFLGRTD